MKWTPGAPPPRVGVYLIQYDTGELDVATVELFYRSEAVVGEGRRPFLCVQGDVEMFPQEKDSFQSAGRYIKRHYGPIKRPPQKGL